MSVPSLLFCALTSGYLSVRRAGEGCGVDPRGLAGVGGGLVVMVVGRRHPHRVPSQVLQLRQPLGESQGAGFDLVHLLAMTCETDVTLLSSQRSLEVICEQQVTSCLKSDYISQGLQ